MDRLKAQASKNREAAKVLRSRGKDTAAKQMETGADELESGRVTTSPTRSLACSAGRRAADLRDVPEGPKVSARLIFTAEQGGMVWRSNFNGKEWKPALAVAGLIPEADGDGKYESAARAWHARPTALLRLRVAGRG